MHVTARKDGHINKLARRNSQSYVIVPGSIPGDGIVSHHATVPPCVVADNLLKKVEVVKIKNIKTIILVLITLISMISFSSATGCGEYAQQYITDHPGYKLMIMSDSPTFQGECQVVAYLLSDDGETLTIAGCNDNVEFGYPINKWYLDTETYYHFLIGDEILQTCWKFLKDNRREFSGENYTEDRMNVGSWKHTGHSTVSHPATGVSLPAEIEVEDDIDPEPGTGCAQVWHDGYNERVLVPGHWGLHTVSRWIPGHWKGHGHNSMYIEGHYEEYQSWGWIGADYTNVWHDGYYETVCSVTE